METPLAEIAQRLENIESMLRNLTIHNDPESKTAVPANGITLAERITGLKKGSIYNLVQQRKIPHYKRGKRLYFDQKELLDWIRKGKRKTLDEVAC